MVISLDIDLNLHTCVTSTLVLYALYQLYAYVVNFIIIVLINTIGLETLVVKMETILNSY